MGKETRNNENGKNVTRVLNLNAKERFQLVSWLGVTVQAKGKTEKRMLAKLFDLVRVDDFPTDTKITLAELSPDPETFFTDGHMLKFLQDCLDRDPPGAIGLHVQVNAQKISERVQKILDMDVVQEDPEPVTSGTQRPRLEITEP